MTKNIWLDFYLAYIGGEGPDDSLMHEALVKEARNMSYTIIFDDIYDIFETQEYLVVSNWCDQFFVDQFCLWAGEIHCKNEQDAFAFKMRWL